MGTSRRAVPIQHSDLSSARGCTSSGVCRALRPTTTFPLARDNFTSLLSEHTRTGTNSVLENTNCFYSPRCTAYLDVSELTLALPVAEDKNTNNASTMDPAAAQSFRNHPKVEQKKSTAVGGTLKRVDSVDLAHLRLDSAAKLKRVDSLEHCLNDSPGDKRQRRQSANLSGESEKHPGKKALKGKRRTSFSLVDRIIGSS